MIIAKIAALSSLVLGQTSAGEVAPGSLQIVRDGAIAFCPLEKTTVNAEVSGFGAEVTVVQKFTNTSQTPIEAVYTFPLPADAAIGRMRIRINDRVIEGQIKQRDEARLIYDQAKRAGQAAALLDQERPNIFTQSVANITPGATIEVEISYVEILKYKDGEFEFSFPMVVGPRFLGNAPDPTKISPPIAKRTGTNIELTVNLRDGGKAKAIRSMLHEITQSPNSRGGTEVKLKKQDELPNRDFILRYAIAGDAIDTQFVTHTDARGGFFSLVVFPPKRPAENQIAPRELIFVMDQSGSQNGFPIEKSKELTLKLMSTMRPGDTFNVLGFNNAVRKLWDAPRPFNETNASEARAFVSGMTANGGTQLRDGVIAALAGAPAEGRLRLVLFNTDGFIGDESAVLETIQKSRASARMFTFGIGNSVNRFLIDAMAQEGRGDAEVVTLNANADAAVGRFAARLQSPVLTDVTADFSGPMVSDVQPAALPDVFADKPIVIFGRFTGSGPGTVKIRGNAGGKPWSKDVAVNFAAQRAPAIPVLWARKRVAEIQRADYIVATSNREAKPSEADITKIGLDFGIMTAYTSFVAVEKRVVNIGGKQRTVQVPVEQADGVSMIGEAVPLMLGNVPASLARTATGGPGGAGSGGMGGGGFGAGTNRVYKLNARDKSEKATNEVVLRGMPMAERKKNVQLFLDFKVEEKIRISKAKTVDVQIFVTLLDAKVLELIKKAGFTIADKDATLKVVFGSVPVAKLGELAILDEVLSIKAL